MVVASLQRRGWCRTILRLNPCSLPLDAAGRHEVEVQPITYREAPGMAHLPPCSMMLWHVMETRRWFFGQVAKGHRWMAGPVQSIWRPMRQTFAASRVPALRRSLCVSSQCSACFVCSASSGRADPRLFMVAPPELTTNARPELCSENFPLQARPLQDLLHSLRSSVVTPGYSHFRPEYVVAWPTPRRAQPNRRVCALQRGLQPPSRSADNINA